MRPGVHMCLATIPGHCGLCPQGIKVGHRLLSIATLPEAHQWVHEECGFAYLSSQHREG